MAKWIVKVGHHKNGLGLHFPKKLIDLKRWNDVGYVLLDDSHKDYIIIRRFVDEKSLKHRS